MNLHTYVRQKHIKMVDVKEMCIGVWKTAGYTCRIRNITLKVCNTLFAFNFSNENDSKLSR